MNIETIQKAIRYCKYKKYPIIVPNQTHKDDLIKLFRLTEKESKNIIVAKKKPERS